MIEGVTKFTAQQLDYKRTTRVVQAETNCCAPTYPVFSFLV